MIRPCSDFPKRAARIPILAALVWSVGCQAELPEQVGGDAGVGFDCSEFADQLIAFSPPGSEGDSETGSLAIGPPDSLVVGIEPNAALTVAFVGLGSIVNETGSDLRVHGSVSSGGEVAVYVGSSEFDRVFSGSLSSNSLEIDIATASASTVSYVQLVGLTGQSTVDAIESLQTRCP